MGASAFGSISAFGATPPAPGVAQPSFLYADLQSRSLWLGVDPTVNPIGAVLISDIVQTQADIIAAEVNAKLYTDVQITTRAPLVHTHYASDIDDFEEAVDAAVSNNADISWIPGTMMMWGGPLSSIGVGQLAGWALCDGRSLARASYPQLFANIGTTYGSVDANSFNLPDLRDRFLIGAGNLVPGQKNPLADFKTDLQGVHTHTIYGVGLSEAQIPSHAHVSTLGPWRFYGATYGGAGAHNHAIGASFIGSGTGSNGGYVKQVTAADIATTVAGAHDHSCYIDMHVAVATDYRGGGAAHTHTEGSAGAHQHTITTSQVRDASPYFALAFIMKL